MKRSIERTGQISLFFAIVVTLGFAASTYHRNKASARNEAENNQLSTHFT